MNNSAYKWLVTMTLVSFVLSTPVTQNWVYKKYNEYINEIAENTPQQHFKCGHNLMGVAQSIRPSLPSWVVVCTAPTPIVYYNSLLIFWVNYYSKIHILSFCHNSRSNRKTWSWFWQALKRHSWSESSIVILIQSAISSCKVNFLSF
jgi:hypothetical protein